jgi:hypothetical protein
MDHPIVTLFDLIDFAELLAETVGCAAEHVFDPVGLILPERGTEADFARSWDYNCTPLNATTFAHTGCDGTHFGLFNDTKDDAGQNPVVMTRPTAFGNENLIVGDSIWEFLSLGYHIGYFEIESLHLDHLNNTNIQQAFAAVAGLPTSNYGSPPFFQDSPTAFARLSDLRVRFQLSPWPDVPGRLKQLNDAHIPQLRFRNQRQEA